MYLPVHEERVHTCYDPCDDDYGHVRDHAHDDRDRDHDDDCDHADDRDRDVHFYGAGDQYLGCDDGCHRGDDHCEDAHDYDHEQRHHHKDQDGGHADADVDCIVRDAEKSHAYDHRDDLS